MKKKFVHKFTDTKDAEPPKHCYKIVNKRWVCKRCGNELGTNGGKIPDCHNL